MEVEELRENGNEEEEEGERKRLKKRIYGGRGVEGEWERRGRRRREEETKKKDLWRSRS